MFISFSPQNYTVPEGTPADIMIVLDKPSPKDINITVTTMDITAEGTFVLSDKRSHMITYFRMPHFKSHLLSHPDPDDYTGGSFTVLIPAGTVKVTVSVATLNDNFVEDDEYFKATLSLPGSPEAVEVGSPDMAFVTITDETRMLGLLLCLSCMHLLNSVQNSAMYQLQSSFLLHVYCIVLHLQLIFQCSSTQLSTL